MLKRQLPAAGAAMFIIGLAKAVHHATSPQTLEMTSCLGRELTLSLPPPGLMGQAHCWGCYVALAGLIVLATGLLRNRQAGALGVRT